MCNIIFHISYFMYMYRVRLHSALCLACKQLNMKWNWKDLVHPKFFFLLPTKICKSSHFDPKAKKLFCWIKSILGWSQPVHYSSWKIQFENEIQNSSRLRKSFQGWQLLWSSKALIFMFLQMGQMAIMKWKQVCITFSYLTHLLLNFQTHR